MAIEDKIEIQILDDGTIKVITPGISGTNHRNADQMLAMMSKIAGGEMTRENTGKRGHIHKHATNKVSHSH